nr:putative ribonuclease H-like domain-containing protein [Tanacetum cinerariifolium]
MASKQFSLEPGLSNLNETGKYSNLSVSQVFEASKKDLEDLFHDFYDEYFDSSKIMKSSTTNVETSINEEVFHEAFESFQGESSSSSLNDDVQHNPKEVILPQTNTQSIPINMVPNGDKASTSHNVFNERLEDAYFDDETPEVLKYFLTMIQRNLQAPMITVRTDRGTEFLNKTLNAFFKEEGIKHQISTARTPEQNGIVERRNRTLVWAARTMLSTS